MNLKNYYTSKTPLFSISHIQVKKTQLKIEFNINTDVKLFGALVLTYHNL